MKKLSRKIVWLLLIVFVLTVGSGFSVRRSAALPGAGEQLSGCRVEKIERLDTPGGKTAYLTHETSGGAVAYIPARPRQSRSWRAQRTGCAA